MIPQMQAQLKKAYSCTEPINNNNNNVNSLNSINISNINNKNNGQSQ